MRAVVATKYGSPDVLELREVDKPRPGDNEILIKIHASTVTAGDCEVRRFDMPTWIWLPMRLYMGIRKPRINILGQELAGIIEETGKNVTRFKKGDAVFLPTDMSMGAYAEYKCVKEDAAIALKPKNMSFGESATLCVGGINALYFLRKARIEPGDKVLIYGAGGSIGTYGVQIARYLGAEVTAVDSADKLEMLRSIGAEYVIDYRNEDFTAIGKKYDVILDVVGKSPYSRSIRALTDHGRYLLANPNPTLALKAIFTNITSHKRALPAIANHQTDDLNFLKALVEEGKLKAVVDRRFKLEELAEAHRYVETGRKKGNVIIEISREL